LADFIAINRTINRPENRDKIVDFHHMGRHELQKNPSRIILHFQQLEFLCVVYKKSHSTVVVEPEKSCRGGSAPVAKTTGYKSLTLFSLCWCWTTKTKMTTIITICTIVFKPSLKIRSSCYDMLSRWNFVYIMGASSDVCKKTFSFVSHAFVGL
jgi:hypothetical protein